MFKIKFKDLQFISNRKTIFGSKVIIFFYGLGCNSQDLSFLLKRKNLHRQILIAELPGHNKNKYINDSLVKFSRKVYLFIRRNKIREITFFAHSLGGIIPIILVKNFIKKKIKIRKFINYEGNLTKYDTETLTKKTVSYEKSEFIMNKFQNLIKKCLNSEKKSLKLWGDSLLKTSPSAFYDLSKECVKISETNELLNFFRIFFKRKVYVYGEKTQIKSSEYFFGSVRCKIRDAGHFSFLENKEEFGRTFWRLI
ncbi:MAG: hypothetical protein ACJ0G4_00240 [Alphaproteobacteria bacterium]